jgi:hypothetical protein
VRRGRGSYEAFALRRAARADYFLPFLAGPFVLVDLAGLAAGLAVFAAGFLAAAMVTDSFQKSGSLTDEKRPSRDTRRERTAATFERRTVRDEDFEATSVPPSGLLDPRIETNRSTSVTGMRTGVRRSSRLTIIGR